MFLCVCWTCEEATFCKPLHYVNLITAAEHYCRLSSRDHRTVLFQNEVFQCIHILITVCITIEEVSTETGHDILVMIKIFQYLDAVFH